MSRSIIVMYEDYDVRLELDTEKDRSYVLTDGNGFEWRMRNFIDACNVFDEMYKNKRNPRCDLSDLDRFVRG